MNNQNNNISIKNISNEIWHVFNSLRGSIPVEDFNVLLFILSGYRDGLFDNLHPENKDLNEELIKCFNSNHKYDNVIKVYSSIIKHIPNEKLSEILFLFNRINQNELIEFFPEVFDSLLNKLTNIHGKSSGEFIQPFEISRLIMNLADLKDNATVYNPFAGLASFATFLNQNQRYYGQEIIPRTWALGQLRLMAYNLENFEYKLEDSIKNWNEFDEFDLIVSNPPLFTNPSLPSNPLVNAISFAFPPLFLGIQLSRLLSNNSKDYLANFIIIKGIEQIAKNGQLICVLPQSFLYNITSNSVEFRKGLIENNFIDTIISLPPGILKHTSIPVCIIIFKKSTTNQDYIKFVNASKFTTNSIDKKVKVLDDLKLLDFINSNNNKEIVRYVNYNEIHQENYNLSFGRYFIDDNFNGLKLSEFAHYISGTRSEKNESIKLVRIKNLKDDIVNFQLDIDSVEYKDSLIPNLRKIEQDCLLLATRWKSLKPTYFKYEGEPIYIANDIIALKIDERKVYINYLINELHSEYVNVQLNKYRNNGVIPIINRDDLFNIRVELPSIEEQNKKYYSQADKHLSSRVEEFNAVYNEQVIDVNDENSFLRHQIAGSLKNIRGAFNFIKKILEEQVKIQIPDLDQLKADQKLETTFSNYINIIERDLLSINKAVNKVGDKIELMDLNIENFDLVAFIKEYAESLKIRSKNFYSINLNLDENAILEYGMTAIHIEGDKDLLRKMFDNIIENAEKHAFKYGINNSNQNKINFDLMYSFEDFEVQLDICNTGKPLPESMTHESMIRKGSTSGKNAGDGVGIWFVNEVMKIHKGKFGFTDETGPEGIDGEYVTSIELTFPIIPAI